MRISGITVTALAFGFVGLHSSAVAGTNPTNLYVSPQGKDTWSGALPAPNGSHTDGPKSTLDGARLAVQALNNLGKLPANGAVVNILPGSYVLSKTFQLQAKDSGTASGPIIYRGTQPGAVEISGGIDLKTWKSVSDSSVKKRLPSSARSKIVEADLTAAGLKDLGRRQPCGFYMPRNPSVPELFFEDKPMTVAQWPNTGWTRVAVGSTPSGWSFRYAATRASSWSSENDVWIHGFFYWDWADYYERVTATSLSAIGVKTEFTPSYGFQAGARFVFLNVLEELDTPGEYYLDTLRGKVYFYPPAQQSDGRTVVSAMAGPLVELDNVSHVRFEGLSFRFSRGDGLLLNNCDDIAVNGCLVSNMGLHGIEANGVTHSTLKSSDICNIGFSGIIMQGGDRWSLTPSGDVIDNCHVANTGRTVMTSEAGIILTGVGTTVSNCSIHDLPQMAVRIWGNNHLIVGNEIYRTCLQTSDSGAIYLGRNFSEQGNVIQNNYFHDILQAVEKNPAPGAGNTYQTNAVYLDDYASGTTVVGNIFQRVNGGIQIGGGRDNTVRNNAFLNCDQGLLVDARGLTSDRSSFTNANSDLMRSLQASNYQSATYRAQYPHLAAILSDDPACPKRNYLQNNVSWIGSWMFKTSDYPTSLNPEISDLAGVDPGFSDIVNLVLTPKAGSPSAAIGFKAVDGRAAGLKLDAYRLALPTAGAGPKP